jgi:hypothetical protein
MMNLSTAAQAVLDAYFTHADLLNREVTHEEMLAAALRAAADQVCPSDAMEPRNYLPMAIENNRIRCEILAIANELAAVRTDDMPEDDEDHDHPSLTAAERNPSLQ